MHREYSTRCYNSFRRQIFPTRSLQPLSLPLVLLCLMFNLIWSIASFRRDEYFTYSSRRLWFFVPRKQRMVNNAHLLWLEFVFFSKFKISVHVFVGSFHLCARFDALCDSALNSFKTVSYTENDYKRRNHSLRYQIR